MSESKAGLAICLTIPVQACVTAYIKCHTLSDPLCIPVITGVCTTLSFYTRVIVLTLTVKNHAPLVASVPAS